MPTIADMIKKQKEKYNTNNNTFKMFPIGTKVQIITPAQDFNFFYDETGIVVRNSERYLGITIKFDSPRHFKDGYIQKEFNFDPSDLIILEKKKQYETRICAI